ncbi:MAG: hypothetical protein ACK4RK_06030 [Gemmataceae bacterium]
MDKWYRVFGVSTAEPDPAALMERLHEAGFPVRGDFHGDDQGWFRVALTYAADAPPLDVQRYLASEEGIRAELNNWAAWLETFETNPHHGRLMEHMIATQQLFTMPRPLPPAPGERVDALCLCLCQFLAQRTEGVYQIDDQGFFTADGTLLVAEE